MSNFKQAQIVADEKDLPEDLPITETVVVEGGVNQLSPFTRVVTYEEYQQSQAAKKSNRS